MTELTALHPPLIAAGLAAILIVMQMGLMAQTGLARGRRKVVLGVADDREIERLARRHGNLAENAALLIAGIALAEMLGAPAAAVQAAAGIALAARVIHALAFSSFDGSHGDSGLNSGAIVMRIVGSSGTGLAGFIAAGAIIWTLAQG